MTVVWSGIFVLAIVCLILFALLFASRHVEQERKENRSPVPHVHRWRRITEWARQCSDRKCSLIEIGDGAPDGMPEYLQIMTTRQAKEDPIREALIYPNLDPRMSHEGALVCDVCHRIRPDYYPHCPYCDEAPEPLH